MKPFWNHVIITLSILLIFTAACINAAAAAEEAGKMSFDLITDIQLVGAELNEKAFSPENSDYTASVPYETKAVRVKVSAAAGAVIRINDVPAENGAESQEVPLNVGNNVITVSVRDSVSAGKKETAYITVKKAQDPALLYQETYRPQFHNTPQMFLMNDPNGLVYNEETKEYHLFYQYAAQLKPNQETKVWAHAVSKDLVYWKELPIAIYPDQYGEIYSGSAVIDRNNTSGLFDENTPPGARMVALYTSYSGKFGNQSYGDQNQGLAYSLDNGVTWIKYEGNPVLPNAGNKYNGGFRDPKVIWFEDASYENGGIWIMVVGGGNARLFTSPDLINWTFQSTMRYENGRRPIVTECPDLFPIALNGDENNMKWVYMGSLYNNGDSRIVYVVGDLKKNEDGVFAFAAEYSQIEESINGNCEVYAQQTFFNDPKGRRVAVSWIRDWTGFDDAKSKNVKNWLGTHTLPLELKLVTEDGVYKIKQELVEEVQLLRYPEPLFHTENRQVSAQDDNLLKGLTGKLYEIEAEVTPGTASKFGFRLRTGGAEQTVVYYDVQAQQLVLDRTDSGIALSGGGAVMSVDMKPADGGRIKLRILIDTSIIDIYGNVGDAVINTQIYPSVTSEGMAFFTEGGDVTVNALTVYQLDSIYFSQLKDGNGEEPGSTEKPGSPKGASWLTNSTLGVICIILGICLLGMAGVLIGVHAAHRGKKNQKKER